MRLTITFPNGTIDKQSIAILSNITGRPHSSIAILFFHTRPKTSTHIFALHSDITISTLLPEIKILETKGYKVATNALLISLTYDLVLLATQMNEASMAGQLEECAVMLTLKYGL